MRSFTPHRPWMFAAFFLLLLIAAFSPTLSKPAGNRPTAGVTPELHGRVCINMIVKDEAEVIERMLLSVVDHIHCWVICDTGSTDNTPHLITSFFAKAGLKGALLHHKWVDFGHNRNLCLQSALEWSLANAEEGRTHEADYMMFMDADQELIVSNEGANLKTMGLRDASYYVDDFVDNISIRTLRVCSTGVQWRWSGAVHEVLERADGDIHSEASSVTIKGVHLRHSNERQAARFERDAALLEAAVAKDPTDARSMFYLGNTYKDMGEDEKAVEAYIKRIHMEGWVEEAFLAAYNVASIVHMQMVKRQPVSIKLKQYLRTWLPALVKPDLSAIELKADQQHRVLINMYLAAHQILPYRQEPLYKVALLYRTALHDFSRCAAYAVMAHALGAPEEEALFPIHSIYRFYSLDELCQCGYYAGPKYFIDGLAGCRVLLSHLQDTMESEESQHHPALVDVDKDMLSRTTALIKQYEDWLESELGGNTPFSKDEL